MNIAFNIFLSFRGTGIETKSKQISLDTIFMSKKTRLFEHRTYQIAKFGAVNKGGHVTRFCDFIPNSLVSIVAIGHFPNKLS